MTSQLDAETRIEMIDELSISYCQGREASAIARLMQISLNGIVEDVGTRHSQLISDLAKSLEMVTERLDDIQERVEHVEFWMKGLE